MATKTKAQVVAELEAAGVEFDATLPAKELVKLLPKEAAVEAKAPSNIAEEVVPKDEPVTPEEAGGTVAPAEEPKTTPGAKDSATVYAKNGNPLRTYTKEVHGKDFKELAKSYAGKIGGTSK